MYGFKDVWIDSRLQAKFHFCDGKGYVADSNRELLTVMATGLTDTRQTMMQAALNVSITHPMTKRRPLHTCLLELDQFVGFRHKGT